MTFSVSLPIFWNILCQWSERINDHLYELNCLQSLQLNTFCLDFSQPHDVPMAEDRALHLLTSVTGISFSKNNSKTGNNSQWHFDQCSEGLLYVLYFVLRNLSHKDKIYTSIIAHVLDKTGSCAKCSPNRSLVICMHFFNKSHSLYTCALCTQSWNLFYLKNWKPGCDGPEIQKTLHRANPCRG